MVYDISSRGHSGLPEVGKALSRSQELSPAVQIAGQLSRIRLTFSSLDPEIAAISPPPGEGPDLGDQPLLHRSSHVNIPIRKSSWSCSFVGHEPGSGIVACRVPG